MPALKANACRPQALYLFISGSNFLVELTGFRVFWRIVAAQLVDHFADGKLIYLSHRNFLCAALVGSALIPRASQPRTCLGVRLPSSRFGIPWPPIRA